MLGRAEKKQVFHAHVGVLHLVGGLEHSEGFVGVFINAENPALHAIRALDDEGLVGGAQLGVLARGLLEHDDDLADRLVFAVGDVAGQHQAVDGVQLVLRSERGAGLDLSLIHI